MLKLFDPNIRKYKSIRAMGVPLMTAVGETVPRELILQAAKDLRMLRDDGRTVVMDAEDEVVFFMDRAIHDIPWPKERWIEQICNQRLAEYAPREQEMLKAHCRAYFSLHEVMAVHTGRGLTLRDVFDAREFLLTDLALSETAQKATLLAIRPVTLEGITFTSGVIMPFTAGDTARLAENFTSLFEKKKGAMTWEAMIRRYAGPYFFREYKKGDQEVAMV